MEQLKFFTEKIPSTPCPAEAEEQADTVLSPAKKILQDNFLEILSKLIELAKAGNLQAVKLLYPEVSRLFTVEEAGVDPLKDMEGEGDDDWS